MSLTAPLSQETGLVGRIVTSNVTESSLTIYATFEDKKTGAARTPQSTTKLFTLSKDLDTFEMILADSHSTASGITTIIVNASGRSLNKYGGLSGSATGNRHPINYEIGCADTHLPLEIINEIIRGNEGTSANSFRIGAETDSNIRIYAQNADASKPYIEYNATSNKWLISNDGSNTFDPEAGGSGVTGGDGVNISGGTISIDLTDTTKFVLTSSGAGDSGKAVILNASGRFNDGFVSSTVSFSTVTTTTTELNRLAGISANVTAANLNTLTAGAASNADALHVHSNAAVSFYAAEAITADQAVAALPIQVEFVAQLTDANLAIGDSNIRRKHSVKFIPSVTTSTLTTMIFRAAEAVNGATTLGDLTISIQTDSAGAPSGTAVSNGTANVITQVTQRTWNTTQANRTATWAASPTLTAGTTYHLVFEVAATDAANYLNISVNSSHDENYITFTRQTYNLDTASWGGSVTNATPYFWFNAQPTLLGLALVPTDASWGGRTWNFVGFAKANISAGAAGDIYVDLVPDLSGLEAQGMKPYYLSETVGAITLTPPSTLATGATEAASFMYKVGYARSSTVLKIQPGAKRVCINELATPLTATTARNYVTWFQPEFVRVSGAHIGGNNSTYSQGYVLGTVQSAVAMTYANAGAGALNGSATQSMADDSTANNDFVGVASALTSFGFTYTFTEAGTSTMAAFLEVTQ